MKEINEADESERSAKIDKEIDFWENAKLRIRSKPMQQRRKFGEVIETSLETDVVDFHRPPWERGARDVNQVSA